MPIPHFGDGTTMSATGESEISNSPPWLRILVTLLISFCALATHRVAAQQQSSASLGGLPSPRQVVPQRAPRPGETPESPWQPQRDEEPVSSFIETLKGNDAAFEVVVGQGRLLTTKDPIQTEAGIRLIAVGDPTVIDFEVLPNPRMIRVIGKRAGVTDLSVTTANDQTYSFEVHVVYDLELLRAKLRQLFPDALLHIAQLREHLVVEGQARTASQVTHIIQTMHAYLTSVQVPQRIQGQQPAAPATGQRPPPPPGEEGEREPAAEPEGGRPSVQATFAQAQIINLIRVPGPNQVLLKVRIAELNRTAMRQVGADLLAVDPDNGNLLGTMLSNSSVSALADLGLGGLVGAAASVTDPITTTAFGIFPSGDFALLFSALRANNVLKILAEPNLVTLTGHTASFLAGGEFPIPVPQSVGGGTGSSVTVEFREFGVRLNFTPYIIDDETIRLTVAPEVSNIDFTLATTLVVGGDPVPGLTTRKANTTVELGQGQTLAMAGLMQVEMRGTTSRIPLLGDLPYIGPFFSSTSNDRIEKELLVLVTPYLVEAMEPHEVPPSPGDEVYDPNDLEFYLLNRIEGRTGQGFRATTKWDDPWCAARRRMQLEQQYIRGSYGFSE